MNPLLPLALALVLLACSRATPTPTTSDAPVTTPAPDAASIGSARMEADGTLVLDLRAEDGAGTVGHAQLRYPKGHAQYQEVLDHIGGLTPGQEKPVPPWQ